MAPYFAYVFRFLEPINIIERIKRDAVKVARAGASTANAERFGQAQAATLSAMEELTDITSNSISGKDKIIASRAVDALKDFALEYLRFKKGASARWFAIGEPPPLTPTFAKPTAAEPTFRAGTVWHQFSSEMTDQLKRLSRRAGVTLFTTIVAGYAALLYRYSGCTDVVVGGPAANRRHWKLEPLIGSTLNILAYRFDLTGNPDVLTLLARVRATVVAALTHQDVPFASIAPMLEPDRQRTGPLFRTVLTFCEDTPHHQLDLPGMKVTFLEKFTNQEIRPELFPVMWEDPIAGTLTSYWLYREDLFSAATMAQMVADYEALLIAMIDDPTRTIDTLVSRRPAPRT